MATLQGRAIKDTYKDLLQVSNSNAGVDATTRTVEDGEGTSSALQISTGEINVNGDINLTGKLDDNYERQAETNDPTHLITQLGARQTTTRTGPNGYTIADSTGIGGSEFQLNCTGDGTSGASSVCVRGSGDPSHFIIIESNNPDAVEAGYVIRNVSSDNTYCRGLNSMLQVVNKRYAHQFIFGAYNGFLVGNGATKQATETYFAPTLNVGQTDWEDNTKTIRGCDLGIAALRWKNIFAENTTISSSDANLKTEISELSEAEKRVAIALKGLVKKFKFKNAVAIKGDNARIHIGLIAQEVQDAFTAEGLDVTNYSLFCETKWYEYMDDSLEVPSVVQVKEPVEGKDCEEKITLGIRYEEVLGFIISAL